MPPRRTLPDSASVARPAGGPRLSAPSALRNRDALCALLQQYAPTAGHALEIASGTGEHVVAFADCLPGLEWQPSDIDPDRRASVDAWAARSGLENLHAALSLDATAAGWAATLDRRYDLVMLSNLLHLVSRPEADTLVDEAARALAPSGRLIVYGPFKRAGELTSDGDRAFDADLRSHDPAIGYKDDFDTIDRMHAAGLTLVAAIEMPANNLSLIAQKEGS